ncbi:zinc finger protein 701-like [Galleria mellonella]|uniref:Zinc finger protein 701-like n=1 Tax=Galleria mellonella TaxID=7137 RepID=A0ABM3MAT3_GALME|nr:zinc finger protein 701-like [Galleria mellonella]
MNEIKESFNNKSNLYDEVNEINDDDCTNVIDDCDDDNFHEEETGDITIEYIEELTNTKEGHDDFVESNDNTPSSVQFEDNRAVNDINTDKNNLNIICNDQLEQNCIQSQTTISTQLQQNFINELQQSITNQLQQIITDQLQQIISAKLQQNISAQLRKDINTQLQQFITDQLQQNINAHFKRMIREILQQNLCTKQQNVSIQLQQNVNAKLQQNVGAKEQQNENKFVCDLCNKEFPYKRNLTRHKRIHLGTNRFHCNHCNYQTNEPSKLRKHILTHYKNQLQIDLTDKFICDSCTKEYSTKKSLKRHERNIHIENKRLHCDHCNYKTNEKSHLRKHVLTHTK